MSDAKYGQVIADNLQLYPDEPVFVLRAKDSVALPTLVFYQVLCQRAGSPEEHLKAIGQVLQWFASWENDHPDLMKVPD